MVILQQNVDVKNFVNEKSFEDQNIKNLHYVLDKLNFELKQEENNIKQLYKYYKENNIKLSSTPMKLKISLIIFFGFSFHSSKIITNN